jgi:hypothetical protein
MDYITYITYDDLEKMAEFKVQKNPTVYKAFVAKNTMDCTSVYGNFKAYPGDIIILTNKDFWVVTQEYFDQNYVKVEDIK